MKTNVIMLRKMGQFEVKQRTKDGYFNGTELLKQWNKSLGMKKEIKDFFENQGTKGFIEVLNIEEFPNGGNSPYIATRGNNGGTWMHPILFIKFAMWINPRFEYFVIKFVYDQLIEYRHTAGDNYKGLTASAQKFSNVDYVRLAKALNHIVFGKHENGIRQHATQNQLRELTDLQQKLSFSIDMGFINSFDMLIDTLAGIYRHKYLRI